MCSFAPLSSKSEHWKGGKKDRNPPHAPLLKRIGSVVGTGQELLRFGASLCHAREIKIPVGVKSALAIF